MRHVLRKRRVGPGFHLELLVTDVRSDRALEDIQGLVLARVGMDWRFVARPHEVFDDGPLAARLLADDLQLGGRATAVGRVRPAPGPVRTGSVRDM